MPDISRRFRRQEETDFGDVGAKRFFCGVGVKFFFSLKNMPKCTLHLTKKKSNLDIDAREKLQNSTEKLLFSRHFQFKKLKRRIKTGVIIN